LDRSSSLGFDWIGRVEGVGWEFGIDGQVGSILASVKEKGGDDDMLMSLLGLYVHSHHLNIFSIDGTRKWNLG
jgi:hypothetical protein